MNFVWGLVIVTLIYCGALDRVITWIIEKYWTLLIRLNNKLDEPKTPEFDLESIYPWQAQYIVSAGQIDFEDLILSYVFWMANKGYIKIWFKNKSLQIRFAGLDSPKLLGVFVDDQLKNNTSFAIAISNISIQKKAIISYIGNTLRQNYIIEPNLKLGNYTQATTGFLFFGLIAAYQFKSQFEEIFDWMFIFVLVLMIFMSTISTIFDKVSLLNQKGRILRQNILQYRYYLQKAEKEKLNFANNPNNQILQSYLIHLPFAVAFGYLKEISDYGDLY